MITPEAEVKVMGGDKTILLESVLPYGNKQNTTI